MAVRDKGCDVSLCHICHQVETTYTEVGEDGIEPGEREPCLGSDVLSIWDARLGERKEVEVTCRRSNWGWCC